MKPYDSNDIKSITPTASGSVSAPMFGSSEKNDALDSFSHAAGAGTILTP